MTPSGGGRPSAVVAVLAELQLHRAAVGVEAVLRRAGADQGDTGEMFLFFVPCTSFSCAV